jgi:hypothetical protein
MVLLVFCACFCLAPSYGADKITFWNTMPQRGTNCMNEVPTEAWFRDAKEINLTWVRLVYDKWDSEGRDFLLGDADNYQGLMQKDLHTLKQILLWADRYDLKIVLTPLSLPGCRWSQNNNQRYDARIWEDYHYQEGAIRFWVDLAKELSNYDCIVAYDIINEPYPEIKTGLEEQTKVGDAKRFSTWYAQYKNTPHDLYDFYKRIIQAIRQVDRDTPIMVESGFYAQPPSYCEFPDTFSDDTILYSVHMYEPYAFTSNGNFRNGAQYTYPGTIPFGDGLVLWNRDTILTYFEPFEHWIKTQHIPLDRIVVSEFGCMRRNPGAEAYLADLVSILEEKKYHWAFYAFREDAWDGYDYEIGTKALPWTYWQARERGEFPPPPRADTPLFNIIRKPLR